MAIGASLILENSSTTDANSYSTASLTATANRLYLLVVGTGCTTGAITTPTASGGGLGTWTLVESNQQGTGNQRITVLRAMSSSPGAGAAVVIDYAGVTQHNTSWKIIEFTGVPTTGSQGADAVAESVQGDDSGTTNQVSLVGVTAGNATFGCIIGNSTSITLSADTGFTALGAKLNPGTPSTAVFAVWSSTGTNPISINSDGTPITALIGCEIVNAPITLAGVTAGVSTAESPAMPVAKTFSGVSAGVSTTPAQTLTLAASLAGVTAGVSTVPSQLLLADKPLAGVTAGVSTTPAPTLILAWALASRTDGVSTVPAAVLDVELAAIQLAGVSAGVSTVTGTLTMAFSLAGVSAGVSTVTAPLALALPLSGSTAGVSTAAGVLTFLHDLAGIINGVSTVTGDISQTIGFAGLVTCLARVYGDLTVDERIYIFVPPVVYGEKPYSDEPSERPMFQTMGEWQVARRLFKHYNMRPVGRSVLKIDGVYVVMECPSQLDEARATEVYLGGHEYHVSADVAAALGAAGFEVI